MQFVVLSVLCAIVVVNTEPYVYFREEFDDGGAWTSRWVESSHRPDYGKLVLTAGKFYGDAEKDKGLQTSQDARFYSTSARFEPFSNEGKTLVVQFTVKHEQNIDCGGGYVKLFPAELDQSGMHGDSRYNIMFGPDICGPSTKKVHVIINYKDKNHLINKDIRCKDDEYTHLYTLILRSDNSYEVKIDNQRVEGGSLEEDWGLLPPRRIRDPQATKPQDWDDRERVDDPADQKPEGWDKPENVPDPDAKKPEDWDEQMDGEWEPPMISNPEYKGEWKGRMVDNPAYRGKWEHPEIDNPEFSSDPDIYRFSSLGVIGLDLWQVKSGTIFDNFLITDDPALAEEVGEETWGQTKGPEKKMKETQEGEERRRMEQEEVSRRDQAKEEAEAEPEEEEEVEEQEVDEEQEEEELEELEEPEEMEEEEMVEQEEVEEEEEQEEVEQEDVEQEEEEGAGEVEEETDSNLKDEL